MPIFQASVINKYLKNLDSGKVDQAFAKFKENYNSSKIALIRSMKEEEYQDGFLRDLFVDVLGYTLKPDENFDLVREHKNQTDGKKADGAILKDEKAIAVIELKSTKTKDLKNITEQAFGYKNNQDGCKYVITSNFQKLRFYIDYTNEFEEFDLFDLTREDFDLLYLILSKDSVFSDLPLTLKKETKFHEEDISNKLYKDYSVFKNSLYRNLIKNNAEFDKLTLFKKSQKLLDRFLFILFAEDSGLLPPNSISRIINTFDQLKELDAYKPLYDIYKQYFGYMNVGRPGKSHTDNIPAYNGGLFYPDSILDNLKIDDDILIDDLIKLSAYDFNTEIDVNILGHIFEHSLSEIEEITAEIEGVIADKTKSKRKKDGVFYTPKYITQYIVENTVGTLCSEKRIELDIVEIEFDGSYRKADGTLSAKGKKLYDKLTQYKDWLLTLKIVDPACGSGAFLNQALNFLIQEHEVIDDIIAELTNSPLRLFDTDKAILENNLYGVDINEESIEIAKLSLWLRTAQKGRKLSVLSNNIKCGNSLIDDPEVAGGKAFDWGKEFPEIMGSGGFDVVIGNPPYVRVQQLDYKTIDFLKLNYKTALKRIDISLCFIELSKKLIKPIYGLTSFITSNQFLTTEYGQAMRSFLLKDYYLVKCLDFGDLPVFEDALTYVSIFIFKTNLNEVFKYYRIKSINDAITNNFKVLQQIQINQLSDDNWNLSAYEMRNIFNKLSDNSKLLGNIGNAWAGLFTGLDDILMFDKDKIPTDEIESEILLPVLRANNCIKYLSTQTEKYVIYPYKYENGKTVVLNEIELKNKYPKTFNYLKKHKDTLGKRKDSRKLFANRSDWYALTRFGQKNIFDKQKIVSPGEVKDHKFCIDYSCAGFSCARVFAITVEDASFDISYILCLLNSKVIKTFLQSKASLKSGGFYSYSSNILNRTPIKIVSNIKQQPFIDKADLMLDLNRQLQGKKNKFISRIQSNFDIEKISKKLGSFYEFDFKTFVAELKKQKIVLSLSQQDEWEDYFSSYKTSINELQAEISKTDKEIDEMVYRLYGLTEEEVEIVEGR